MHMDENFVLQMRESPRVQTLITMRNILPAVGSLPHGDVVHSVLVPKHQNQRFVRISCGRPEQEVSVLWISERATNLKGSGDRMSVVQLSTVQQYEDHIKSKDLSVTHFYASWADQCTQINDVLNEMSTLPEYKDVKFAKVEAENVPEISLKAAVTMVPTVLLTRSEKVIDRVDGANPSALTQKIKLHLANKDTVPLETPKDKESLESRLKKLVNQAPCMLFMKGNPATPRCGFSRTIVSLLDSYKADYSSFDILQDNEVREGLKKFSNWPTYPQLYINGELIGGLDIVKEMSESGDLESMLPKKTSEEKS